MWEDIKLIGSILPLIVVKLLSFIISVICMVIFVNISGALLMAGGLSIVAAAAIAVPGTVMLFIAWCPIEEYLLQNFYYFYVQYIVRKFLISEECYNKTLGTTPNLHVRTTISDIKQWISCGRWE